MSKTWKDAYSEQWKVGHFGFDCGNRELTSLEGAPRHVNGNFVCSGNHLVSLNGAPEYVGGFFDCSSNRLTSLEGIPSHIGGPLFCGHTLLTSLKDIHLHIKRIGGKVYFHATPIASHVLGLLLIEGLNLIRLGNVEVEDILNRHLPSKGMESVLEAQDELISAGLDEFAQL